MVPQMEKDRQRNLLVESGGKESPVPTASVRPRVSVRVCVGVTDSLIGLGQSLKARYQLAAS